MADNQSVSPFPMTPNNAGLNINTFAVNPVLTAPIDISTNKKSKYNSATI